MQSCVTRLPSAHGTGPMTVLLSHCGRNRGTGTQNSGCPTRSRSSNYYLQSSPSPLFSRAKMNLAQRFSHESSQTVLGHELPVSFRICPVLLHPCYIHLDQSRVWLCCSVPSLTRPLILKRWWPYGPHSNVGGDLPLPTMTQAPSLVTSSTIWKTVAGPGGYIRPLGGVTKVPVGRNGEWRRPRSIRATVIDTHEDGTQDRRTARVP